MPALTVVAFEVHVYNSEVMQAQIKDTSVSAPGGIF